MKNPNAERDESGVIFIDRSPQNFATILDFLGAEEPSKFILPRNSPNLLTEINFYEVTIFR